MFPEFVLEVFFENPTTRQEEGPFDSERVELGMVVRGLRDAWPAQPHARDPLCASRALLMPSVELGHAIAVLSAL